MHFDPGDIVLLTFPFTGETGSKRRPALVLLDAGDDDILVARVTTQQHTSRFDLVLRDWKEAGLIASSSARLHKLATLEKSLVDRRLGGLSAFDWSQVRALIAEMLGQ
jgi:mRNA interferase MazF